MADKQLEDALKLYDGQDDKAVKTARYGKYVANEGADNEQTFVLKFPGTFKYLQLQGIEDFATRLQETFKETVYYPKIKSLDYFDEHSELDFNELYTECASFLETVFNPTK